MDWLQLVEEAVSLGRNGLGAVDRWLASLWFFDEAEEGNPIRRGLSRVSPLSSLIFDFHGGIS